MKTSTPKLWSREGCRWRIELYGGECDDPAVPGMAIITGIIPGQVALERWRMMPVETLCSLAKVLVAVQKALADFDPDTEPDAPRLPSALRRTVHENDVFAIAMYLHRDADDSVIVTIAVHDSGDPKPVLYAEGDEFEALVSDFQAAQEEIGRLCHA